MAERKKGILEIEGISWTVDAATGTMEKVERPDGKTQGIIIQPSIVDRDRAAVMIGIQSSFGNVCAQLDVIGVVELQQSLANAADHIAQTLAAMTSAQSETKQ